MGRGGNAVVTGEHEYGSMKKLEFELEMKLDARNEWLRLWDRRRNLDTDRSGQADYAYRLCNSNLGIGTSRRTELAGDLGFRIHEFFCFFEPCRDRQSFSNFSCR